MTEEAREAAFKQAAEILRPFEPTLAGEIEFGCLRLQPGESFFTLRAQDVTAPGVVREWIRMNEKSAPVHKLNEARAVLERMERWAGPRKNAD